jgi:hypothetical protein
LRKSNTKMPAYNFQKQFAEKVESGAKPHTFRMPRKDGRIPEPGQPLALYTGMRTKACRLLKRTSVAHVFDLTIDTDGFTFGIGQRRQYLEYLIRIGVTETVGVQAVDQVARLDGFPDFEAMLDWLRNTHGLPATGHLICWKP